MTGERNRPAVCVTLSPRVLAVLDSQAAAAGLTRSRYIEDMVLARDRGDLVTAGTVLAQLTALVARAGTAT